MTHYYAKNLSGKRLQRCYDLASPRILQYLEAETRHILTRIGPADAVLELGCGYGRVTFRLADLAGRVVGIDNADDNLRLARELDGPEPRCEFFLMDALDLTFDDDEFDAVVCVQNGICAFNVDREALLREALRVTRPGGIALFSSYLDRFWPHRLAWFEAQAAEGLLGPIDRDASGDGFIVCKDGFRAGRMTPAEFEALCASVGVIPTLTEVDDACLVCAITAPE
jgi:2-polyprenyl-6-hydroxyphenyl methylase/3-demethylubiquinone-9 3-methyltransferase